MDEFFDSAFLSLGAFLTCLMFSELTFKYVIPEVFDKKQEQKISKILCTVLAFLYTNFQSIFVKIGMALLKLFIKSMLKVRTFLWNLINF